MSAISDLITARDDRIAQLERDLAEARAELDRLKKENRDLGNEIDSLEEEGCDADDTIRKLEAERDRLAAALQEIANGCEGRVDRDSLPCRIASASLQTGEKVE